LDLVQARASQAWDICTKTCVRRAEPNGWNKEKVEGSVTLYTRPVMHGSDRVRMFRVEGVIDGCSPRQLYDFLCNISVQSKWNKSVVEISSIHRINEETDITRVVSSGAGPISSREFINTRKMGPLDDGAFMISGQMASIDPDGELGGIANTVSNTRGVYGPGGYAIYPVEGQPNSSFLVWVLDVNMRGWLMRYVVERAVMSECVFFIGLVRGTVGKARAAAKTRPKKPSKKAKKPKPSPKKVKPSRKERESKTHVVGLPAEAIVEEHTLSPTVAAVAAVAAKTEITDEEFATIQRTWGLISREDFADTFFSKVFEGHPEIRSVFAPEEAKRKEKFIERVDLVLRNIQDNAKVDPIVGVVAKRFIEDGLGEEYMQVLSGCLCASMIDCLGEENTDEVDRIWIKVWATVGDGFAKSVQ